MSKQLFVAVAVLLSLTSWTFGTIVTANEQVGTLTQLDGTVKLFSHPGKQIQGPPPHALFEGTHYSVQDAKVGDRVELNNILRTAPGARARIVFDNGDQFNVGPATAYKISWQKSGKQNPSSPAQPGDQPGTNINLMYGKLRAIINKGGPRSRLLLRTKTATMGVRGTDFFVADGGMDGAEVSVIRGVVKVESAAKKAIPVELKSGDSADVASVAKSATPASKFQEIIAVRRTTKEELHAINIVSQLKFVEPRTMASAPEVAKTIEKLEEKAAETTLNDIKSSTPALLAAIVDKPVKSASELNSLAVNELTKAAPKAPRKRKPSKTELDDLEKGAYEKYFKIVD